MIFDSRTMLQGVFICVLILIGGASCVELNVHVPNQKIDGPQVNRVDRSGITKETLMKVPVRRAAGIPLFPVDVDKIFEDVNAVANSTDCSMRLTVKDGGVGIFGSPQIIHDEFELNALNNRFNGLKVVKEIRWCNQFWPDILGCQKDTGIIVVRPDPSQEAILWLHEIGHLNGLHHRNQPFAVMNEFIGPMNKNLTLNECAKYHQ